MLWKERQDKVEEFTFDSINTIADELGVDVPFYPEVYWVGRKLEFESIGLSEKYEEEFDKVKKNKTSVYLVKPKVILIGGYFLEDIGEEASHFLHLNSSNITNTNLKNINDFCMNSIIEMFGFFGSKLIKPSRKNPLKKYKDELSVKLCEEKSVCKKIDSFFRSEYQYDTLSEVYHQGYQLGEKLFNTYISKLVPKTKIRELFTNPLSKENEPLKTFIGLKYNMVGFLN